MSVDTIAARLRDCPPIQVVYTDLDGTLLGPGGSLLTGPDGSPSAAAAAALADAAAAGVIVVPVSGRQAYQLRNDARIMGLTNCIAEAGSVIIRDGTEHLEWGKAPTDIAATPHDALIDSGAYQLVIDTFGGELRWYHPWADGRRGGILMHGHADVDVANEHLAEAGLDWAYLLDNGATGGWDGRTVRAYHLMPRGVGKATAVADDLAARGLDPSAAVAVGDSLEDARMASAAGTYVQVANGHAEGALTTPSANGAGFAELIEAVLAAREDASPG